MFNRDVHYTTSDRVYFRDNKELWIIRKVQVFNASMSLVTMEQVGSEFQLNGKIEQFSGDCFMKGSGFGGGPYLRLAYWLRFSEGSFYTILDQNQGCNYE